MTYRRKKHRNRIRLALSVLAGILLVILAAFFIIIVFVARQETEVEVTAPQQTAEITPSPAAEKPAEPEKESEQEKEPTGFDISGLEEEDVYTFLQGPMAWGSKTDWSGPWCNMILGGQSFGIFGCGLCDLANIYSTLTPYDCSPVDMFYYAQEASKYHPVSDFGAIDWPFLLQTLQSAGIDGKLCKKDKTYEAFQKSIAGGLSAIALVSNESSGVYWPYTNGHYVNIWLYDEESDTVLLADSGNPDHNRQRIPLSYVYDSLKLSSNYQYLLVTSVDPEKNEWKHNGIELEWSVPAYYHPAITVTPAVNAAPSVTGIPSIIGTMPVMEASTDDPQAAGTPQVTETPSVTGTSAVPETSSAPSVSPVTELPSVTETSAAGPS